MGSCTTRLKTKTKRLGWLKGSTGHYATENKNKKAGMVERFNRTLREVMSSLTEHRDSNRYVDVLDDLVDGYNNTPHSGHGRVPAKIGGGDDVQRLWIQKFEREFPKTVQPTLKVGDYVSMDQEGSTMRDGQERCLL